MKNKPTNMQVLTTALMGFLLLMGTPTADAATSSPVVKESRTLNVSMTAYNAVPEQTSSHPNITASGAFSDPNIIAARSQDLGDELPFGTVIEVDSASPSGTCGYDQVGNMIGLRVIGDTMNVKWHNKIDILLPQQGAAGGRNPAIVLGKCKVSIHIVGHVSIASIPKTQAQLATAIGSGDLAAAK